MIFNSIDQSRVIHILVSTLFCYNLNSFFLPFYNYKQIQKFNLLDQLILQLISKFIDNTASEYSPFISQLSLVPLHHETRIRSSHVAQQMWNKVTVRLTAWNNVADPVAEACCRSRAAAQKPALDEEAAGSRIRRVRACRNVRAERNGAPAGACTRMRAAPTLAFARIYGLTFKYIIITMHAGAC